MTVSNHSRRQLTHVGAVEIVDAGVSEFGGVSTRTRHDRTAVTFRFFLRACPHSSGGQSGSLVMSRHRFDSG